ncbi:MAG: hypothetical protein QG551_16 [Patescibacteria group bacterium]|jgi:hypothetical protein|nr:hypothetical protein [Patescibacteria group bacterium]
MERFKENLQARHEQNIVGNVMMISLLIILLAVWGVFALNPEIRAISSEDSSLSEVKG